MLGPAHYQISGNQKLLLKGPFSASGKNIVIRKCVYT